MRQEIEALGAERVRKRHPGAHLRKNSRWLFCKHQLFAQVRVFKRLETLVAYLKEIGINRFDVDAANFDSATVKTYSRPDTSATLKQAHAALVQDRWFREQVAHAVKEADDPATQWVANETAMAESAKRRAAWRVRGASVKSVKSAKSAKSVKDPGNGD